jgi:2-hydroxychromene-2-carboxylate isomerase
MDRALVNERRSDRMAQVEFWFDLGSPYSYLAYRALPAMASRHGAAIAWRPMLLGGVFQATGNKSPVENPAKGAYLIARDLPRWARRYKAPFRPNPHFPVNTLSLMRGAVGYQQRSEAEFLRYVEAMYAAMWEEGRNLADIGEVSAVLDDAGFNTDDYTTLIADPSVKARLKTLTEEAVSRGVFGAPTFFVGNEMFWGQDRLGFVEEALAAG